MPTPEETEIAQRLLDQFAGRAKRQYSNGRIGADDEGDLAIAIAADTRHNIVRIDFGKHIDWLGLPKEQAIQLGQLLIKRAGELK